MSCPLCLSAQFSLWFVSLPTIVVAQIVTNGEAFSNLFSTNMSWSVEIVFSVAFWFFYGIIVTSLGKLFFDLVNAFTSLIEFKKQTAQASTAISDAIQGLLDNLDVDQIVELVERRLDQHDAELEISRARLELATTQARESSLMSMLASVLEGASRASESGFGFHNPANPLGGFEGASSRRATSDRNNDRANGADIWKSQVDRRLVAGFADFVDNAVYNVDCPFARPRAIPMSAARTVERWGMRNGVPESVQLMVVDEIVTAFTGVRAYSHISGVQIDRLYSRITARLRDGDFTPRNDSVGSESGST